MALVTVSAIFLRWLAHHGLPILALSAVAVTASAPIYLTQRRRYKLPQYYGSPSDRPPSHVRSSL